jgi:ketopantoate reductase
VSAEGTLQFVVIGAGSLGCVYGANLARIGQQVAFVVCKASKLPPSTSRGCTAKD